MNRLDQMLARGRTKPRRKPRREEDPFQIAVLDFLDLALPENSFHFHIPNGEKRDKKTAAKLKKMGVKAGVPDLCILWGGKVVWIELKATKGRTSAAQQKTIPKMESAGAYVQVCRSLEEVENALFGVIPLRASAKGIRA